MLFAQKQCYHGMVIMTIINIKCYAEHLAVNTHIRVFGGRKSVDQVWRAVASLNLRLPLDDNV